MEKLELNKIELIELDKGELKKINGGSFLLAGLLFGAALAILEYFNVN